MGHDITSYRVLGHPTDDQQKLRDAIYRACSADAENTPLAEWLDEYNRATTVAYIRRGAFNPLNSLIYLLLGCPEYSAGCSGTGETQSFSVDQLQAAIDLYHRIVVQEPTIEREVNMADDIAAVFGGDKIAPETMRAKVLHSDTLQELAFLEESLEYAKQQVNQQIEIHFG